MDGETLTALRHAIEALAAFGETMTAVDYATWLESEPEAGDCRQLYLADFMALDGAVRGLAQRVGIWPLFLQGRDYYGVTRLQVDMDGVPQVEDWRYRLAEYRGAVTTATGRTAHTAAAPAGRPSARKAAVSRPQLAQATVIAFFTAHPNSDPTAEEIAQSLGQDSRIDAATIRNTVAWKLHQRGKKRAADDVGDGADIGDVDLSLEEVTGRQERGRNRSNLRQRG